MRSAWLLPEHIADVLPIQAQRIEALRRGLLDQAQLFGYELVIPPLLEHLDALLSGTGRELDLSTFKLVDQMSGRMLGLRADTTPQAARIDAHLLNRPGVTRLCYCGPVLHTRPTGLAATREPLQFGAEMFGHQDLQADLEVAELALQCLRHAAVGPLVIDLADARVLRGVLAGVPMDAEGLQNLARALASKDAPALAELCNGLPGDAPQALQALLRLYGGNDVLAAAREALPDRPLIREALEELAWLGSRLQASDATLRVAFDLSDMSGYAYYSGPRFALYAAGCSNTLARGGRYDEVGAVFGRNRPAVGFSLDLKSLSEVATVDGTPQPIAAVLAPWGDDPALLAEVLRLRAQGTIVIRCAPDSGDQDLNQADGWRADRQLVQTDGRWVLQPLASVRSALSNPTH